MVQVIYDTCMCLISDGGSHDVAKSQSNCFSFIAYSNLITRSMPTQSMMGHALTAYFRRRLSIPTPT